MLPSFVAAASVGASIEFGEDAMAERSVLSATELAAKQGGVSDPSAAVSAKRGVAWRSEVQIVLGRDRSLHRNR